jgi:hypothetical protein
VEGFSVAIHWDCNPDGGGYGIPYWRAESNIPAGYELQCGISNVMFGAVSAEEFYSDPSIELVGGDYLHICGGTIIASKEP